MNTNCTEIQQMLKEVERQCQASDELPVSLTFEAFRKEKYRRECGTFDRHAFLNDTAMLGERHELSYYQELTSYRKGISILVKPVKRVLRKMAAFLFLPLVKEQNTVNLAVSRIFTHVRGYINREYAVQAEFDERQQELEARLQAQNVQIEKLRAQVEALTKELDMLEHGGESS